MSKLVILLLKLLVQALDQKKKFYVQISQDTFFCEGGHWILMEGC